MTETDLQSNEYPLQMLRRVRRAVSEEAQETDGFTELMVAVLALFAESLSRKLDIWSPQGSEASLVFEDESHQKLREVTPDSLKPEVAQFANRLYCAQEAYYEYEEVTAALYPNATLFVSSAGLFLKKALSYRTNRLPTSMANMSEIFDFVSKVESYFGVPNMDDLLMDVGMKLRMQSAKKNEANDDGDVAAK